MKQKQLTVLIFVFLFLCVRCEAQDDGRKEKISEKSRVAAQKELTARGIDYSSVTRFFSEIEENHPEEVELILQAGTIKPDTKNDFLFNGLHVAARKGYIGVMGVLLKYGADIEAPAENYSNQTALVLAIHEQKNASVEFLIKNNANVNCTDGSGYTPLIEAATSNFYDLVDTLFVAGADPFLKFSGSGNYFGKTAREIVTLANEHRYTKGIYVQMIKKLEELEKLWMEKQKAKEVRGRSGNN